MRFLKRVERNFAALLMVPLVGIEQSERERRLKEKSRRMEERYFSK
jgi:hypothetical protein